MMTQGFFSDMRRQKRSLAGLNEYCDRSLRMSFKGKMKNLADIYGYFGNEIAGKKNKSATKIGFLEMLYSINTEF